MKSLPALFTLMVSILLAGMAQVARSVAILSSPGANVTLPSFTGRSLPRPLLVRTMTTLAGGIQEAPAPDTVKPSEPASSRTRSERTETHDRTMRNFNPAWWAIGALVIVALIALIAMSNRDRSGTTVIRG